MVVYRQKELLPKRLLIITRARLCKLCKVFIHLQHLGSYQLADHFVNAINQGPCYFKCIMLDVNEIIGLGRLIIQKEDYQPLFKGIDGPHCNVCKRRPV